LLVDCADCAADVLLVDTEAEVEVDEGLAVTVVTTVTGDCDEAEAVTVSKTVCGWAASAVLESPPSTSTME